MITTVGTISSMMDSPLQMITQQPFVCSKVDPEHCVIDTTNAYQDNVLVLTSTHTQCCVAIIKYSKLFNLPLFLIYFSGS